MNDFSVNQSPRKNLYWVAQNIICDDFPDVSAALKDPDGLLAIGGDLTPERLLGAYKKGIFPWYSEGQPILWWSPDPRCVLDPGGILISRSLGKNLRRNRFTVTVNQAFRDVITQCALPRKLTTETWITSGIVQAYTHLHDQGHALSVECRDESGILVGGLYGIVLGKIFFGESMFSRENDASKVALVHLAHELSLRDFKLIDCQLDSKHLRSLGARLIPRHTFTGILGKYCNQNIDYEWPTDPSCLPLK